MPVAEKERTVNELKRIEFPLQVMKAYFKEKDGEKKYYVEAIASDTGIDYYMERMSENAINKMVDQCKNSIIVLPTHWDTFEIGKTVDAEAIESPFNSELTALKVIIELNMKYPQAEALYDEVEKGSPTKQLSVGGNLNQENDDAAYWEEIDVEIDLPNGQKVNRTYWILVLDDLILDHIAITRANHAANERTGFLAAIAKSLKTEFDENYKVKSINHEIQGLKRIKSKGKMVLEAPVEDKVKEIEMKDNDTNQIRKTVIDFFKSIFMTGQENFNQEIDKNVEKEEMNVGVEKEKTIDGKAAETVTPGTKETPAEPVVKSTEETPKTEEKTEEKPVVFDEEKFKTNIMEEFDKKFKTNQATFAQELVSSIAKSVGEAISKSNDDLVSKHIQPLADKIKSIEEAPALSKGIEGQDGIDVKVEEKEQSVWKGILSSSEMLKAIQAAKADAEDKE